MKTQYPIFRLYILNSVTILMSVSLHLNTNVIPSAILIDSSAAVRQITIHFVDV
jgi:hypothetical protein